MKYNRLIRTKYVMIGLSLLTTVFHTVKAQSNFENDHELGKDLLYSPPPTDPNISANTKKLYEYLVSLPEKDEKRIIAGQVFDGSWHGKSDINDGFYDAVVRLYEKTDNWVAMLHSWFDYPWARGVRHMSADFIYPVYYNYFYEGAILMLLVNPYNPWSGLGIHEDRYPPEREDISALIEPGNLPYHVYREYLENLADLLSNFQKDDIPIIIRLFGENNGSWFWFHHGYEGTKAEDFRALWIYTVEYLRIERGLNNLLFCYEATEHSEGHLDGLVLDYTDILGIQVNTDIMGRTLEIYNQYLPLGKPIMIPQFLPRGAGKLDYREFIEAIKKYNPNIVAFSPWFSGVTNRIHGLADNLNVKEMFDDPWVINMKDTPFSDGQIQKDFEIPKRSGGKTYDVTSKFEWGFNNMETQGWSAGESIIETKYGFYSSDNGLNVFYHGENPCILSPENLNISTSDYNVVRIRLRNHSTSTRMEIHWLNENESQYNEHQKQSFEVKRNELDYREYIIDLSNHKAWKGFVSQLKINLAPYSVTGSGEIDYIILDNLDNL